MKKLLFTILLAGVLMSLNTQQTVICTGKNARNGTLVKLLIDSRGLKSIVHYNASGEAVGDVVYTDMTTAQFSAYCLRSNYIPGC